MMQTMQTGRGSLQSLDWNGGMEWWNGIVECVLQGETSLLCCSFFFKKVTVEGHSKVLKGQSHFELIGGRGEGH